MPLLSKSLAMFRGCKARFVFGNSEDRFSHDMAYVISLFPCLKIIVTFNKVS